MRIRVVAVMLLVVGTFAGAAPQASADHGSNLSLNIFMSNFRFCEGTPQCVWPLEQDHENVLKVYEDTSYTIHWDYNDTFCDTFDGVDEPVDLVCEGHQLELTDDFDSASVTWSSPTSPPTGANRNDVVLGVTFNSPGTYQYRCAIHGGVWNPQGGQAGLVQGMTGQIEVTAAP